MSCCLVVHVFRTLHVPDLAKMEVLRLSALFTILVCLMRFERTDGISNKDMDDYCGSRITLYNDHQIALQFSDDEECEVTIETTRQFPMMMLYIKSFSVSCLNGNVSIRNQYGRPPDGLSGALCGSVSSSKMYKSDGEVKIKYNPIKGIRWTYGSFTLIITLYTDSGTCPSWGHVCDNGWCIDAVLKCNGYYSCGDNSGCLMDSSDLNHPSSGENIVARSVGIVVGVAVGVIFVTVVTVTLICCRRRAPRTPAQLCRPTAPQMHVVYATAPTTGHFNQGFSNENYGIHMQHTTANFSEATLLYGQPPPPYNPSWAPKEMKPEGQYASQMRHNVQANDHTAIETEGTNAREDPVYEDLVYDNIAIEQSEVHYSTLAGATGHVYQR